MTGDLTVLGTLALILAMMVRGSLHPWSPRLGRVEVRSGTGENAGLVLAVVSIARLISDGLGVAGGLALPGLSTAVVGGGVVLVIGLVRVSAFTRTALGIGGLAAFLMESYQSQGPPAAGRFAALAAFLLIGLRVARGFTA